MTTTRTKWHKLLARTPADLEEVLRIEGDCDFGPHAQQLLAAIQALRETPWCRHVGEPFDVPSRVVRVDSWTDALLMLDDEEHYVRAGCLTGPWHEMHRCEDEYPVRHDWWVGARQLITNATNIETPQVEGLDIEHDLLLTDYVYDFLNLLMMEIVFSDVSDCTYFREQLTWFHAGHLPCGWEGAWPAGKMRVF